MAQRDLVVRFIGDDRDLQRAFTTSERRATAFQGRMARLNQAMRGGVTGGFGGGSALLFGSGAFIGTAAITRGMSEAIEQASNLNEQIARSRQVFEENAVSVQNWSKSLASSFGIAQSQGLEFAGTFGLLFRNVGLSSDEAESFSRQLVELGADLASFNNTTVDDALNALRSGLTGEIEPLRRFGVFLNEARSNTEALATSGKKTAAELTTQEKILARLSIIMEDTSRAQGDFARTSDGLANKQRIAAAEAQNLAANMGQVLAPAMDVALTSTIFLTGGINDLVASMGGLREALRDTDFFDGFNSAIEEANDRATGFFENLRDNIPLLNEVARLRAGVIGGGVSFAIPERPEEGRGALDAAAGRARQLEKDAKQAERDLKRARDAFDEFSKGMELKLDRARLTASTTDDIAALRELERAILRRMRAEGRTFKLVQQLTDTRLQINALVQTQAEDAKQAGIDAFNATMDALDLGFEVAQSTQGFADDQKALRAIEQAILRRIASEGQSTELLRELFDVRERQRAVAKQIVEQARERRQERQFLALGLTEEGDRPTPGVAALSRRLTNLREQIKGTALDTDKTQAELDRIAKVLSGKFGKVGKEVRAAILQMFNDISSALNEGDARAGPLTKTSGLNTRKILAGLGLTDEQINELRGRLSSVNTAGQQLGVIQARQTRAAGTAAFGGVQGAILVESHTTINLDGQEVARVVTRNQQKARRRNPTQKRGPNRSR